MPANVNSTDTFLINLIERYPQLQFSRRSISQAYDLLEECYSNGGKLLIAGNGGSVADAEHIVGELMKGFIYRRSQLDTKSRL